MIGFFIALWWLIGAVGFVFWWTSQHDLKAVDLIIMFIAGFTGPFSWGIGWAIHGDGFGSALVILRQRKQSSLKADRQP
jgi:hypothetical protein